MKAQYIVWVAEKIGDKYEPNGDGLLPEKTAIRINRELRRAGYLSLILPEGIDPVQRGYKSTVTTVNHEECRIPGCAIGYPHNAH